VVGALKGLQEEMIDFRGYIKQSLEKERERENNKRKIGCIWLQNVFTKKKNKNSGFPSPTSMCTWKSRKFVPGQPLSKHMWKKLVFLTYS
jgi:hypothetical protein